MYPQLTEPRGVGLHSASMHDETPFSTKKKEFFFWTNHISNTPKTFPSHHVFSLMLTKCLQVTPALVIQTIPLLAYHFFLPSPGRCSVLFQCPLNPHHSRHTGIRPYQIHSGATYPQSAAAHAAPTA